MPSKSKNRAQTSKPGKEEEDIIDESNPPDTIEPYTVLNLDKSATADQVKSAYRRAALKHHPDKVHADRKQEAHIKFQEIAFAYAILSDPIRRKRYDITGSISESIPGDDENGFCWAEFFREQFRDVVTADSISQFAQAYKGSSEEMNDLLAAYRESKGKWNHIYEVVMMSDPLEDEERFRMIIDRAIEDGKIQVYKSYANETERSKKRRLDARIKEKQELAKLAEDAGASALLESKSVEEGNAMLKSLIQKKNSGFNSFLDNLEAKYATTKKRKKNTKEDKPRKKISGEQGENNDPPSEEAFLATQKRLEQNMNSSRKSKRLRH